MAGSPHSPGFHPHLPGRGYTLLARGVGATMWFFIFYRLRQDGGKLLGHHPFMDHGHGDHHAPDAGHH
ncbi:hypothetical protein B0H16DRAFT_1496329 [Mycena metata]|uniref:NADH dehydrogenase [ubiquinone] 1 beta subcomplex subunit 2 n=2 Tax=Mycena TaxID=41247 RepID=A0AAD7KDG5_9AGAR|nr:hypothetical protein B0H16DRAFT_1496329 [Mycena metata]